MQFNLKFNIKILVISKLSYLPSFQNLGTEGIPATDKIAAIKAFKPPANLLEIRTFIRFCNYFWRMVPNFRRFVSGFIGLTKKNLEWCFETLLEEAQLQMSFEILKKNFSRNLIIGFSGSGGPVYNNS